MQCKYRIVFSVSAYVMPISGFAASVPIENHLKEHEKNNTINMVFLGSVDGKGYFVEYQLRTWAEAREFWIASGMHLASITTLQEVNFLHSKMNYKDEPSYFCGGYWIGGKIAITGISDFVWDHNNQTVENPGLSYDNSPTSNRCLGYETSRDGGYIYKDYCFQIYAAVCEAFVEA